MNEYFYNPKAPTLEETYDASISASTEVTFATGTTYIEVSAIDKGIFMKWAAAATSSDFDEFIPANTSKRFPILSASAQFIEEAATAHLVVIEK